MYTPDPEEKFDFQNLDVKLYLALKKLLPHAEEEVASLNEVNHRDNDLSAQVAAAEDAVETAKRSMYEFELSNGPIPDWAVARNWAYELAPGAQLLTKDGRRAGNAHIIRITDGRRATDKTTYDCLTDAGSKFTFNEVEILHAYHVGDWLSAVSRILKDFDRNHEFMDESCNGQSRV